MQYPINSFLLIIYILLDVEAILTENDCRIRTIIYMP